MKTKNETPAGMTPTMEKNIGAITNYFKKQILTNNFEIKNITDCRLEIEVDEKYPFVIWIGNLDIINTIRIYEYGTNFMNLTFEETEKEKLQDLIKQQVSSEQRRLKLEQIERLQNELKTN